MKYEQNHEGFIQDDRQTLIYKFNETKANYPKDKTIHEIFEQQAKKMPDHVAVVYEDKQLTYRQLNERANQLARVLRCKGVRGDTVVGIMAEPSLELIIGIVAILKAGGAYLPLDVDYPAKRINYMIKQTNVKVMLTQPKFSSIIDEDVEILLLNDAALYEGDKANLDHEGNGRNLAYIIYTSGSTGKPKGVMIEHIGVLRLVMNPNYVSFHKEDRILQIGSIAFDASTFQVWGSLLNGLSLYLVHKHTMLHAKKIANIIKEHQITILLMTTALFNQFSQECAEMFQSLRYLLIGGDIVSPYHINHVRARCPGIKLINIYGPTENTTISTTFSIEQDYEKAIPIGVPIHNSTVYILDEHLSVLPMGEIGEIYVGGDGIARGYVGNEALTQEKFINNPFINGEKIYKTGDLGRWLENGNIEFIGRMDNQVKIRGYRIELGEIEKILCQYEYIQDSIVITEEDESNNKYLVAYLMMNEFRSVSQLRKYMLQSLPEYMIPQYFMTVDKIPLTPNGKVDRIELPRLGRDLELGVKYVKPRNIREERIADIWQEILNVSRIGIHDNFFDLGGHSLKAIIVRSLIHETFNIELQLTDIFANPTIERLANHIENVEESKPLTIKQTEEREDYALSPTQRRIYLFQELNRQSTAYNIPMIYEVKGNIDVGKVEKAIIRIIKRQESFRTSFVTVDEECRQKIHEEVSFRIEQIETNEENIGEEIENFIRPFELEKAPLFRVRLIKIKRDSHLLMFDMHHIIFDGSSKVILFKELRMLYANETLLDRTIQFRDYVDWQTNVSNNNRVKKQQNYWLNQFSGDIPILNLVTDYPRPTTQQFQGASIKFQLDKRQTGKVKKMARETSSSLHMLLFAAYNILLSKYSGQEDIIVGTVTAGRKQKELENIIGMFVNTLAIRNYPEGDKTYRIFMEEVKQTLLGAYDNQEYPFEELVGDLEMKRDISRNPLFDTMFVMQNMDKGELILEGVNAEPYPYAMNISKFDFTLIVEEEGECIFFELEYSTALFKEETMKRLSTHYMNILKMIVSNPDIEIQAINMLSQEEKEQLLVTNNSTQTKYSTDKTIHELFEEQVKKTPHNVAVIYEDIQITYRGLNEKANQVARALRERGVQEDTIVAIMVERSIEMVIGILGIQKAGGAYLPIDPNYPQERIDYLISHAIAPILLVSDNQATHPIQGENTAVLDIHRLLQNSHYSTEDLGLTYNPKRLMYVIYTSGSTGTPKGVMVKCNGFTNLIHWYTESFYIVEKDHVLLIAPVSFDLAQKNLYATLIKGGRLVLLKAGMIDYRHVVETIHNEDISIINCTPSAFYPIVDLEKDNQYEKLRSLRKVFLGGEPIHVKKLEEWGQSSVFYGEIINTYGPTECTDIATSYTITGTDICTKTTVPIGKPIANTRLYILDKYKKLVPVGVIGELYIGGRGVARGYYHAPEMTKERFVTCEDVPEPILYRTGDMVRWQLDGNIEFIGRKDDQVKIRGYRIETGEIENQLIKHEQIKEVIVVLKEDDKGNKYLVGYMITDHKLEVSKLRKYLSKKLPSYMIPQCFITLDKIPLTPNGKVNKKALPIPDMNIETGEGYEGATTTIELRLVHIWEEELKVDKVGIHDNFFDLGGHSLRAVNIIMKIQREWHVEVTLADVFKYPTIESLGNYIQSMEEKEYQSIDIAEEKEYYPLSPAQKRIYIVQQFKKDGTYYNMPYIYEIKGAFNVTVFQNCLETLIKRHEALRTHFNIIEQEVVQIISDNINFKLTIVDAEKEIANQVQRFIEPFDLSQAPLIRSILIRVNNRENILIIDLHHIISDGTSMKIFMKELSAMYNGEALPGLKTRYRDYTMWNRKYITHQLLQKQKKYWMNKLNNRSILNLPTDFNRPSVQSFRGNIVEFEFDSMMTNQLKEINSETGTTLYMLLLAIYNILLAKCCGQEDIIVGTVTEGRTHIELKNTMGMFVNTLVMRCFPEENKAFLEFLQEVKNVVLEVYENQDYPFEELINALKLKRDINRNPLLDTMFVLQNIDYEDLRLNNLEIKQYKYQYNISKFDINLMGIEKEGKLLLAFEYSTDLFMEKTILQLADNYKRIANYIIKNIGSKIEDIHFLDVTEEEEIQSEIEEIDELLNIELEF